MDVKKLLNNFLEYFNKPIKGTLKVMLKNERGKLKTITFSNIHSLKIKSIVDDIDDVGTVYEFEYVDSEYSIRVSEKSAEAELRSFKAVSVNVLKELVELCSILNIQRVVSYCC